MSFLPGSPLFPIPSQEFQNSLKLQLLSGHLGKRWDEPQQLPTLKIIRTKLTIVPLCFPGVSPAWSLAVTGAAHPLVEWAPGHLPMYCLTNVTAAPPAFQPYVLLGHAGYFGFTESPPFNRWPYFGYILNILVYCFQACDNLSSWARFIWHQHAVLKWGKMNNSLFNV